MRESAIANARQCPTQLHLAFREREYYYGGTNEKNSDDRYRRHHRFKANGDRTVSVYFTAGCPLLYSGGGNDLRSGHASGL